MSAFGITSSSSKATLTPAGPAAAADHAFLPVSVQLPGMAKKLDIVDNKGNMAQPQNVNTNNPAATQEEITIGQLR